MAKRKNTVIGIYRKITNYNTVDTCLGIFTSVSALARCMGLNKDHIYTCIKHNIPVYYKGMCCEVYRVELD